MRVLMVVSWWNDYLENKVERGGFHYHQAISLKEHCDVAIYFPWDLTLPQTFHKKDEFGIVTYRSKKSRILRWARIINDFIKIKNDFKPDVIHAHVGGKAGFLCVVLGKLFGIPVIITEHQAAQHMRLDRLTRRIKYNFTYSNSCANVCVSKGLQDSLKKMFPNIEFELIHNGTVTQVDYLGTDDNDYAKPNMINFCIVAGFYDKFVKGYQYLLPALKKLHENHKAKVFLHIVGGGEHYVYYKNLAKELGIDKYCEFYGQCEKTKVYKIISQMDFLISSSIIESAGITVQEALLLGKPVLVTNSVGADSLINDEVGDVIEKGSIDALVDGILKMSKGYKIFNSEQIKEYAYANFDMKAITLKYIDLYESIVSEWKNQNKN